MENGCDKISLKHKQEVVFVEEEIKKIIVNIQVSPKSLIMKDELNRLFVFVLLLLELQFLVDQQKIDFDIILSPFNLKNVQII